MSGVCKTKEKRNLHKHCTLFNKVVSQEATDSGFFWYYAYILKLNNQVNDGGAWEAEFSQLK